MYLEGKEYKNGTLELIILQIYFITYKVLFKVPAEIQV